MHDDECRCYGCELDRYVYEQTVRVLDQIDWMERDERRVLDEMEAAFLRS